MATPTALIPAGIPACHANQLAGQFRAGGYATGNATGELLLHNVSPMAPPGVEPTVGAYLVLLLIGAYRDDPIAANGLCSAANEVTPSQFVIAVGVVSVQVANWDPAGVDFKSLYGCHGIILGEGASLSS